MSLLTVPKDKPHRSQRLRDFIRTLPCCACGRLSTQFNDVAAHHQSFAGKWASQSSKMPDYYCLPLCSQCHREIHQQGADTFWASRDRKLLIIETLGRYIKHLENADGIGP